MRDWRCAAAGNKCPTKCPPAFSSRPSKCCPAAAPISSFTIQSILGSGSADPPREAARTLSLSSEDEEPEESWKHRGCFCPEAQGPAEACHKHQPLSFTCLGSAKGSGAAAAGSGERGPFLSPPQQDCKDEKEKPLGPSSPSCGDRQRDGGDRQAGAAKKKTRTVFSRVCVCVLFIIIIFVTALIRSSLCSRTSAFP
uniref:H6 family homeobox 2 n=1 Tax=Malurus cyaneus samueli TaxID=2593467 RepID=A0A8C5U1Z7_9PASS